MSIPPNYQLQAAFGFRAHSGWAALVVLAGPVSSPKVIDRRRIELALPDIPRPVQPYHGARKLDLKSAERYIQGFAYEAGKLANGALSELVNNLKIKGYEAVGCGILLGSGRASKTLKATLASHPLLHTAEGELFRTAIINASENSHLPVTGVKERDLLVRGTVELGMPLSELQCCLTELGRTVGPPWGLDQKLGALAAWLALGARV